MSSSRYCGCNPECMLIARRHVTAVDLLGSKSVPVCLVASVASQAPSAEGAATLLASETS